MARGSARHRIGLRILSHPFAAICRLSVLVVLVPILIALVATGCRRVSTGGRTIGEEDVLRGRPAARGGPELTPAELAQGWVALEAGDESELRNALASRIQTSVDIDIDVADALPGTVSFFANGDVTTFNRASHTFSTNARTLSTPFGSLSVQNLLDQLQNACSSALLSPAIGDSACAGFDFDLGFSPNPIDGLTFEIDSPSIRVHWLPPDPRYNELPVRREAGNNPSGGSCTDNDDCSGGTICQAGVCSCDGGAANCSFGFSCNTSTSLCEYDEVACTEDAQCVDRPDIGLDQARCGGSGLCEKRVHWNFDSDASMDYPVLAIDVTFHVTHTSIDAAVSSFFFPIQVENWTTRFRLQPVPCGDDAFCTLVPPIFDRFSGSSSADGLTRNNHGLRWTLHAEHLGHDVRIDEEAGLLGWATLFIGSAALEDAARDGLDVGFVQLSRALGGIATVLINLPVPVRRVDQDATEALVLWQLSGLSPSWGAAAASRTSFDLAASSFDPDVSRSITTADGALTNAFLEALAAGSPIRHVGFDAARLRALCGPDPRTVIGGVCASNPALAECSSICMPCNGSSSAACDFSADSFSLPVAGNATVTSIFALPVAPDLTTALEGILISGTTARGWLGNVLETIEPTLARFTDIAWCPLGTHGTRCPGSFTATTDRVVLHFNRDGDGDGIPDAFDLCPSDSAVGDDPAADWDGDRHGNACDLCPLNRGANNDRDGDEIGDACDCDRDGDGCNQQAIGVPVSPPPGVSEMPVYSCVKTGSVYDQRPDRSDSGADADADGQSDDCDGDDDNDGILDDGAGDGVETYTPCADGETSGCDDNCPFDANASQEDRNNNGTGDACDPICNATTPAWRCNPGTWERPGPIDFGDGAAIELDPLCPTCLLELRCLGVPALPGHLGGCPDRGRSIRFGPNLTVDLATQFGQLPYTRLAAAFLLPDLDNDGFSELGLALDGDSQNQVQAQLVAIRSSDGAIAWQKALPQPAFELGAVERDGNSIFVGAPDVGQNTGAVFELNSVNGSLVRTFASFTGGGFGTSLQVAGGRLLVGAPLDANGAGRLLVMDRCARQPLAVFDGPGQGFALGSGPMARIKRGAGNFIALGAPDAFGGNGAFVLLRESPLESVFVAQGDPGARLGASLAALEGLSFDGHSQAWVGAPGRDQGSGAVYELNGALEFGRVLGTGSQQGELFGAPLLHAGTSLYVGLPGAYASPNDPGAWAKFDLGDGAFAAPTIGGFDLPVQCGPEPVCGNQSVESPESCDDGNTQSGDGCYASCRTEGQIAVLGQAKGGTVAVDVSGSSLIIPTFDGQVAQQVLQAIADAVNADSRLNALGISAIVTNGRVVTDGSIESFSIQDPGLTVPQVPSMPMIARLTLMVLLALLVGGLARRTKTRMGRAW